MTVRLATELVVLIENLLGWSPPDPKIPLWKARSIEAGKINKLLERDTTLSLAKLELAVHYLHRERKGVTSPVNVQYYVKDALAVAADTSEPTSLDDRVNDALVLEREGAHPDHQRWISHLIRVAPSERAALLKRWETERGHLWAK